MLFFLPLRKSAISCWILSTVCRLTWHLLQREKNFSESFGHVSEPWKIFRIYVLTHIFNICHKKNCVSSCVSLLDSWAKKIKLIYDNPYLTTLLLFVSLLSIRMELLCLCQIVWGDVESGSFHNLLLHLFLLDGSTGNLFFFWGLDLRSFSGTGSVFSIRQSQKRSIILDEFEVFIFCGRFGV